MVERHTRRPPLTPSQIRQPSLTRTETIHHLQNIRQRCRIDIKEGKHQPTPKRHELQQRRTPHNPRRPRHGAEQSPRRSRAFFRLRSSPGIIPGLLTFLLRNAMEKSWGVCFAEEDEEEDFDDAGDAHAEPHDFSPAGCFGEGAGDGRSARDIY